MEPAEELVQVISNRTPPKRRRVFPRSYGKPPNPIQIDPQEVVRPEAKQHRLVHQQIEGVAEERELIELPNGVIALKIAAREFVFVDAEDVATVAAYQWRVRAINSFNGHYRGATTFWDDPQPNGVVLRQRMWLHDLLMDTPFWTPSGDHELDGPRWMVAHADYNGMNCTRANMTLFESPDGFVEVPKLNLPCGVWWNYRRHCWSARVMGPGGWYLDLSPSKTFEEAAGAYFEKLSGWTIADRDQARYAHGTPVRYQGAMRSLEEWQAIRDEERANGQTD